MRLLLTGFEPFGGQRINPSAQIAAALDGQTIAGAQVYGIQLPVAYQRAGASLREAVARRKPDVLLLLGQAGGRDRITIERVAINLMEADAPDNDGVVMEGSPIVPGAPTAYFTNAPHARMLAALRARKIPAGYSFSAGAYLCNFVFFTAMEMATADGRIVDFVHLPFLPEQTEHLPTMDFSTQLLAVQTLVEAICRD